MSTRKQRRKFSIEFKTKVALAALKEQQTLVELSRHFEVHSNQIIKWRKEFLTNATAAFSKSVNKRHEQSQVDKLYRKIGELEMERDFLKKNAEKFGL